MSRPKPETEEEIGRRRCARLVGSAAPPGGTEEEKEIAIEFWYFLMLRVFPAPQPYLVTHRATWAERYMGLALSQLAGRHTSWLGRDRPHVRTSPNANSTRVAVVSTKLHISKMSTEQDDPWPSFCSSPPLQQHPSSAVAEIAHYVLDELSRNKCR
jgi:hypothetical protein